VPTDACDCGKVRPQRSNGSFVAGDDQQVAETAGAEGRDRLFAQRRCESSDNGHFR
jgi:hypothetical protein